MSSSDQLVQNNYRTESILESFLEKVYLIFQLIK